MCVSLLSLISGDCIVIAWFAACWSPKMATIFVVSFLPSLWIAMSPLKELRVIVKLEIFWYMLFPCTWLARMSTLYLSLPNLVVASIGDLALDLLEGLMAFL